MRPPSAVGTADEVPVLMYHSIGASASSKFNRFAVDPGEFESQMDYLAAEGYTSVTAEDFAESRSSDRLLPPRPVVLTFDDAYEDFYSTALPILRKRAFVATLFVATAYVGATARWNKSVGEGDRAILSWQALRDIAAEGVEVAAHSHTHPQLDRLRHAAMNDEASRSKGLLEDRLALQVRGFAYPFGYWNRAVRTSVADAAFRYACSVDELVAAPGDDVFALPRLTVGAGLGPDGFARLLGARPTPGERRTVAAKRVTWQVLRRGIPILGGDPQEGWPA
jgi:peptidoglycan/xylan/chitin deacetylase (PgdA/CDA1 family)